jgi:arginase family enzyme
MNELNKSHNYQYSKKLFGVALDAVDDPWSLQLKRAWMAANTKELNWLTACLDPYDAVTGGMAAILEEKHIKQFGKFPVPSWLWPKPKQSDFPLVNAENMADFFDNDGVLKVARQLEHYVANNIFPDIPMMIGIDHSATAGVISALTEKYGPQNVSVIVLDQHFDAIPLSVRLTEVSPDNPIFVAGKSLAFPNIPVGFNDQFCCGNFWAYLIEEGSVLPENLLFIGVADYPYNEMINKGDNFREHYLSYEERGCSFFPLWQFNKQYINTLTRFFREKISTPYIYISLDLDVGAYNSTFAARYMDRQGISKQNLLDIASIITNECHSGKYEIAGLDIMEFNMHFLGIETPGGIKDDTLNLVKDFIKRLV